MTMTFRLLCVLLLALGSTVQAAGDDTPPWQRGLKGEEARKAAALEQQIDELEMAGKFAEAVKPAEAVLALRQQGQGDKHWQTADGARKVRELKQAAGLPPAQQERLAEAVPRDAEAVTLHVRGKYADADPLFRKALTIRDQVLGSKHPDTARCYNNVASNLIAQGKARDAEPLLRKALAIYEEVLGPKHPDTATS